MKNCYRNFIVCVFAAGFTFLSCSQKKISFAKEGTPVQEFVFQQAKYSRLGSCSIKNPEKYYYPKQLDNFFFRHTLENGENLYLIEKYYPQCKGIIDSSSFYPVECDNGKWIDNLIDSIEEERIGNELLELLENDDYIQSPIIQEIDTAKENDTKRNSENQIEISDNQTTDNQKLQESIESEKTDENLDDNKNNENKDDSNIENKINEDIPKIESVEKRLLDSKNRLKRMEYNAEVFIPQKLGDKYVSVHFYGKLAVRTFYDSLYRIIKKETWSISNIKESKIEIQEEYKYHEKNTKPKERIIKSENKTVKDLFDENGRIIQNKNYLIQEEKEILQFTTNWKYDKAGNVIQEENIENEYDGENIIKTNIKKEKFIYKNQKKSQTEDEIPPDYEYYEDNILKIKTEYTDVENYVTKIFFEDDFVVTSYYENGKKIKDVYSVGGIVRREKKYE